MSYILDALKKLEAKRPHGSVPDLFTVHDPLPKAPKRLGPWVYPLAAVALLGGIILLARLIPRQTVTPGVILPRATVPPEAGVPLVVVNSSPVPPGDTPPPVKPAEETAAPPASPAVPEAATAAVEAPAPSREAAAPEALEPARVAAPPPAQMEAVPSPPGAPAAATSTAPPPLTDEGAAAKTGQPQAPPAETLPKELQDLKISGYVFSDDPGLRMIIIDNRPLREGDLVSTDCTVEEITPEGVSFSYRGNRFRVKRPAR